MAKTHKQHLAQYGYKPTSKNSFVNAETERVWQTLVKEYGEDNVWDYRVLDEVFDTSHISYSFGFIDGIVKRETGESGTISQTDFVAVHQVPRFYYNFVPTKVVDHDPV